MEPHWRVKKKSWLILQPLHYISDALLNHDSFILDVRYRLYLFEVLTIILRHQSVASFYDRVPKKFSLSMKEHYSIRVEERWKASLVPECSRWIVFQMKRQISQRRETFVDRQVLLAVTCAVVEQKNTIWTQSFNPMRKMFQPRKRQHFIHFVVSDIRRLGMMKLKKSSKLKIIRVRKVLKQWI